MPDFILKAFSILGNATYVRQFASIVPLYPDTTFHLFGSKGGYLVLVMTDYPDPTHQSEELKQISGEYAFEFTKLVKPYANNEHIEIKENDKMLDDPTVQDTDSYYRFYVAETKCNADAYDATSRHG